jgi:hypothetical protein
MSGDLLSTLLNAAGSQSGSSQSGGDPLSALLSGLMGGGGAQGAQGGDVLGSLLGGLMGGGGAQSAQQGAGDQASLMGGSGAQGAQGGDVLGSLLGGLMGGGGAQSAQQGAGDQGSLMGGSGAQGAQGGDVLGSLLGGLLGGGASQGGQQMPTASAGISSHPYLAPIINGLAQKLGLPPAIAEVVVSFALTQLLNSLMSRASRGGTPGMSTAAGAQRAVEGVGGLQMEDIAQRFQSGQAIDAKYLRSTGMPQQLAEQTGLDLHTATGSLQHVFDMLASATGPDQQS